MAVPTRSRRTAGLQPPGQAPRRGRRRSVPLAAGGVVLVVVCALVFAEGWLQAGHRQPVLALAQPVAAGQVIGDLQPHQIGAGLVAVDHTGNIVAPFNTEGMYRGWISDDGELVVGTHAGLRSFPLVAA